MSLELITFVFLNLVVYSFLNSKINVAFRARLPRIWTIVIKTFAPEMVFEFIFTKVGQIVINYISFQNKKHISIMLTIFINFMIIFKISQLSILSIKRNECIFKISLFSH